MVKLGKILWAGGKASSWAGQDGDRPHNRLREGESGVRLFRSFG